MSAPDIASRIVAALEAEGFDMERDRIEAYRLAMARGVTKLPTAAEVIRGVLEAAEVT